MHNGIHDAFTAKLESRKCFPTNIKEENQNHFLILLSALSHSHYIPQHIAGITLMPVQELEQLKELQ
jgi:hypothetical protein